MNKNHEKSKSSELKSNLIKFTGTTQYYKYSQLFPDFWLTDGTHYLAQEAESFWLFDLIASHQLNPMIKGNQKLQQIQLWHLQANNSDNKVVIWVEEDKDQIVYQEKLDYTDFPLDQVTLYLQPHYLPCPNTNSKRVWICHLPSEY